MQERIDSLLQLVEIATERAETVAADIGKLANDSLGVVHPHRKFDALTQPGDGELVLADLVVGEAGRVVEPYVVWIRGLQLGPDRGRFLGSPSSKVELGDV